MPLRLDPPISDEPPRYERSPDGRWVLVAPKRLARPSSGFAHVAGPTTCPFCEGNEAATPPEVAAVRGDTKPNERGWTVRVVPNLFPAVSTDVPIGEPASEDVRPGYGRHEVIIERPDHATDFRDLPAGAVGDIFRIYRDRLCAMGEDPRLATALLFKNGGRSAGASQEHAHAQLIGMAVLPPLLDQVLGSTSGIEETSDFDSRLVRRTNHHVAYTPRPSIFPLEVWVAPREREPDFRRAPVESLVDLGTLVRDLLRSLERMIEPLAYNFFLHTSAFDGKDRGMDRWILKIAPRLEGLAGTELGAGVFMNPLPPAWSADHYRKILSSLADL